MDVIGIYIEDLPKKEKHAVGVRGKFLGCKLRPVSLYYNGRDESQARAYQSAVVGEVGNGNSTL